MPEFEIDLPVGIEFASNVWLLVGFGFIALILAVIALFYFARFLVLGKSKVSKSFARKVLLVTVPKEMPQDKAGGQPITLQQIQEKIGLTETFFSTIAGLKSETGFKAWLFGHNDIFSFEIVAHQGKVSFYVAMPKHLLEYIQEQIHAQFPQAVVEEVPDYNMFSAQGFVKASALLFNQPPFFPIKTYKKFEADPLNAITNVLSRVEDGDGAAVQIIIKSAAPSWRNFGIRVASKMQQGKKYKDALREVKGGFRNFLHAAKKDLLKSKDGGQKPPDQYRLSPLEDETVKNINEKANKGGLDANIRIVVASKNEIKLDNYLNNLVSAFNQYNIYQSGNSFKPIIRPLKREIRDFIYRNFDEGNSVVFNTEELPGLFHFPISGVNEAPNINWLDAKKSPAPLNIPIEGLLMGYNIYRGKKTEIRMKRSDRRRHHYVIGMTGSGKSWYIEGLILQDIANGEGCCYIEPHSDAIEHILERIPKERAEDVVVFDPSDLARPMGLNMLEYNTPEQKTFAVNELMNIFDKLYDLRATGGPMFEQYFKNACLLVMSDPESGSTLLEVPRVLSDDEFRAMKLSKCDLAIVKNFWEKEAQKAGGEASLANMVPYITSKLTPFLTNDFIRPIISQQKSTLNFREAMDSGKIILVKLSKGLIGDTNAYLLGMIIIGKLLMAALSRADMDEDKRKDFYLYVDEFQNFLTDSMEIILSEARKYRLALTVAHQYIGQLVKNNDTKFKDAIFGNVGTKVAFRIGVDDAEAMTKEFAGLFTPADFLNMPMYTCYVKLLVDNANPSGFNMKTIPFTEMPGVPKANKELGEAIRKLSQLKFGRDRDIVEAEMAERMAMSGM